MAEMVSEMTGVSYSELIGGTSVPVITKNVTLKGVTAEYTRGTLLSLVGDKYEICDTTGTGDGGTEPNPAKVASAVLAEDVKLTGSDTVATVYVSGMFNREKLILKKEDDTVEAHEEELRDVGIYLTSLK